MQAMAADKETLARQLPVEGGVVDQPGVPASTFGCSGSNFDATLDDDAADPVEDQCDTGGGVAAFVEELDGRFEDQLASVRRSTRRRVGIERAGGVGHG